MENIQVALRVRPQNTHELETNDQEIWTIIDENKIILGNEKHSELIKNKKISSGFKNEYTFNHCFDKFQTTKNVYETIVKGIVKSALYGINGTVFMYGQTGSGKTFTMMGSNNSIYAQMISRATEENRKSSENLMITPKTKKCQFRTDIRTNTFTIHKCRPYHHLHHSEIVNTSEKFFSKMLLEQSPTNFSVDESIGMDKSCVSIAKTVESYPMIQNKYQEGTYGRALCVNENNVGINQACGSSSESTLDLSTMINTGSSRIFTDIFASNTNNSPLTEISLNGNIPNNLSDQDVVKTSYENSEGLLILALKDIFNEIEKNIHKKFFLRCSYIEIYTDLVYDLLKPQERINEVLSINEDSNKEFYIKGAQEEIVSTLDDIMQKIKRGEMNRHYASTHMNHASSRSHTIFRLYLQSLAVTPDGTPGNNAITESILNFVDLAGSEKFEVLKKGNVKRREFSKGMGNSQSILPRERVRENQHINKSLFFLTQVISLRSRGRSNVFIPYRNSPLTKILRSSLGGNSRTAIVLCINPSFSQVEQTISTLRFGLNAKKIENKVQVNVVNNGNNETLRNLLTEYEKKLTDMENDLQLEKTKSGALMELIQKLQEQKKVLAERLVMSTRTELPLEGNAQVNDDLKSCEKLKRDHIHYRNIGILPILIKEGELLKDDKKNGEDLLEGKHDSEGKYALESLRMVKEQNNVLQNKLQIMKEKFEEFEKDKLELIKALSKRDNIIKRKTVNLQSLRKKLCEYGTENIRFRQVIEFYQNKSTKGIQNLSYGTLSNVEKSLMKVLDKIKFQKFFKHITKQVSTNDGIDYINQDVLDMGVYHKEEVANILFGDENEDKTNDKDFQFDEGFFKLRLRKPKLYLHKKNKVCEELAHDNEGSLDKVLAQLKTIGQ